MLPRAGVATRNQPLEEVPSRRRCLTLARRCQRHQPLGPIASTGRAEEVRSHFVQRVGLVGVQAEMIMATLLTPDLIKYHLDASTSTQTWAGRLLGGRQFCRKCSHSLRALETNSQPLSASCGNEAARAKVLGRLVRRRVQGRPFLGSIVRLIVAPSVHSVHFAVVDHPLGENRPRSVDLDGSQPSL